MSETEKSNEFVGPIPVAIKQFIDFYVGTVCGMTLVLLFLVVVAPEVTESSKSANEAKSPTSVLDFLFKFCL